MRKYDVQEVSHILQIALICERLSLRALIRVMYILKNLKISKNHSSEGTEGKVQRVQLMTALHPADVIRRTYNWWSLKGHLEEISDNSFYTLGIKV